MTIRDLDESPLDVADAYLRLHLLSHRLVRPNSINLDGLFAVLPNVCWTSLGPIDPAEIADVQREARHDGHHIEVCSLDKFPRMLDYVVPSGVRVADASRVRLDAYLGEGTTVMHEGFVNYNAGTLGPAMVEGRINQGVVVGANSDIGGGRRPWEPSREAGLNASRWVNAAYLERTRDSGLGLSLGDDCVVEAGLYLTAGMIVILPDGTRSKALANQASSIGATASRAASKHSNGLATRSFSMLIFMRTNSPILMGCPRSLILAGLGCHRSHDGDTLTGSEHLLGFSSKGIALGGLAPAVPPARMEGGTSLRWPCRGLRCTSRDSWLLSRRGSSALLG